jgi:hypothetical protein
MSSSCDQETVYWVVPDQWPETTEATPCCLPWIVNAHLKTCYEDNVLAFLRGSLNILLKSVDLVLTLPLRPSLQRYSFSIDTGVGIRWSAGGGE